MGRLDRKLKFYLLVGAVLVLGAALIYFGDDYHIVLLEHLGSAMIVSAILAFTLERYLKTELVQDAVKVAIGYVLPPELRPEMEWIYGQTILCEGHVQTTELELVAGEDLVLVKTTLRRTFRNVGPSSIDLPLDISVDEWFSKAGQSAILAFGLKKSDGTRDDWDCVGKKAAPNALSLAKAKAIHLQPNDHVEVWSTTTEIKRTTDRMTWVFARPTREPTVIVRPCVGLAIDVTFDHREKGRAQVKIADDTYRLQGVLLPFQALHVRWWNIATSERWLLEKLREPDIG